MKWTVGLLVAASLLLTTNVAGGPLPGPAPSENCDTAASLQGTYVEDGSGVVVTGIFSTGGQTLGSGGSSHYWSLKTLSAGQEVVLLLMRSGFSPDFHVRVYEAGTSGCVLVHEKESGLEDVPWYVPQDGAYVVEIQAPETNGGMYRLTVAIAPPL